MASEQRRVQSSLRVVRGHYSVEAIGAAAHADISFLSTSTRVSLSASTGKSAMGVRKAGETTAPVYTYYDGQPESQRTLLVAADLSESLMAELVILMPRGDDKFRRQLKNQTWQLLGAQRKIRHQWLEENETSALRQVTTSGCSLLVMPRQHPNSPAVNSQALNAIDCPLVLVA